MTDPIDYSRPVGWWCPVCGTGAAFDPGLVKMEDAMVAAVILGLAYCENTRVIPRYLPIPEGQRPLVEDEVESAEVVTLNVSPPRPGLPEFVWYASSETRADDHYEGPRIVDGQSAESRDPSFDLVEAINRIAQASARARIVTGATE